MSFLPKDGVSSEADRVFGLLIDTPVEGVVTYDALDRVLGRDFRSSRGPYYDALNRYHEECPEKGTFVAIPNEGYKRVADIESTTTISEGHRRRARRQIRKAYRTLASTDRAELSTTERTELDAALTRIGRVEKQVGALTSRFRQAERRIGSVEEKLDEHAALAQSLAEQVAALTEQVQNSKRGA